MMRGAKRDMTQTEEKAERRLQNRAENQASSGRILLLSRKNSGRIASKAVHYNRKTERSEGPGAGN